MAQALRTALALPLLLCACAGSAPPGPGGPVQEIEGLRLSRTQGGRLQWTLASPRARLLDETEGTLELEQPRLEVYRAGASATRLSARRGTFDQESRDVRLVGDVVVLAEEERGFSPSRLRTERLDFVAAEDRFRTDAPVTLERRGSTLRGKGLTASRDLSEIRILRQETRF